jgi:hypothetical protein
MTFEQITDQEKVGNLCPIDLLIHARHLYLSAAKDLLNRPDEGDREIGLQCAQTVEALQAAIDVEITLP